MPLAIWPQPVQLINVTHALPKLLPATGPQGPGLSIIDVAIPQMASILPRRRLCLCALRA